MCIDLNMSDQVTFLGKQLDVRPYIAASDLYVIPTLNQGRKEGMPMALVEAMSMEIPILGSDISGINYVLKDFSELLVEAGNVKQLASQIERIKLLSSAERMDLGNRLRAFCIEHFTVKSFVTAHEFLYEEIMN